MHPRCNHTCIRSGARLTRTAGCHAEAPPMPRRGLEPRGRRACRCPTCSSTSRPPRRASRGRPLPPRPTHARMAASPAPTRLAASWGGWARWVARCAPLRLDSTRCRPRALDARERSPARRKPPTPPAAPRWWARAVTHQRPPSRVSRRAKGRRVAARVRQAARALLLAQGGLRGSRGSQGPRWRADKETSPRKRPGRVTARARSASRTEGAAPASAWTSPCSVTPSVRRQASRWCETTPDPDPRPGHCPQP